MDALEIILSGFVKSPSDMDVSHFKVPSTFTAKKFGSGFAGGVAASLSPKLHAMYTVPSLAIAGPVLSILSGKE